jgi:outer membrane receptor protein involved in Fe transport
MKTFQAFLATLLVCASAFAQSGGTAQISGTVHDPSGSAVPGAQVKATKTDTDLTRTVETGADGSYILPNLPIGPYRLEIMKDGFSTSVQNGIVLQVASSPTVEITLQLGAVSQQVQVEASALTVETRSSGVGQVVDQQRVVDLPLNGRNPTDLIYLAGAAAQAPNADLVSTKNYPNEAPISVAGGAATGTTYMMDGGSHNDPLNNLALPLPFPDALQEFKVETSALPAMYGQHSGAAVNAVTKSGTNTFHGDAFEFVRNFMFNARQFNAPARDTLKRNQYGATIGGPIKKDKLFFFAGYQGTDIRTDPTGNFTFVPTQAMLNGDFTAFASAACNGGVAKSLKGGFVNNMISPTAFNSASLKMMSFYTPSTDPCGKTFFGVKQNFDEESGVMKVDYNMSDKQSLFVRYYGTHAVVGTPFDGKNPLTETISGANDLVNSMVIGDTYIINASTINSFHFTGNRSGVTKTQLPSFDANTLGINMTTLVPGHIVATASSGIYSSTVFSYAATDPVTAFQSGDDLSMTRGNHQLQFGFNWMHSLQNVYGPLNADGNFTFNGQTSGLALADFLLGDASAFTQGGIQYANERYTYIGAYAQDTWKLTPRLTVNLGIRWEPYFGNTMSNGHVGHFYPDLFAAGTRSTAYPNGPPGYLFAGDPQFDTSNRPAHAKLNDFAPRIGVAWDPTGSGKTSIRASWGIFYDLPQTLFAYGFSQEPPWGTSITRSGTATAPISFSNPWAGVTGGNPFPLSSGANALFPANAATYASYPLNLQITYLEQWNVSLQRQIGTSWLFSASYLGNNTMHLWSDDPINAPLVTGATTAVQSRRPLTLQNAAAGAYYGVIHQLDTGGTASYNAMLLSAQHRLTNNFTVLGNYTWSHCITDPFTSELDGTQWTNPSNRRFDRGNCVGIDHRHIINVSAVAETPKYGGRVMQALVSGWKVSPIMRISSGSAYSITSGIDNAVTGLTSSGERANQVLANPYCVVQTPTCWLNPAAFATPATGTLGNVGAGSIHGPGSFTLDASLSRQFKITERQRLEIRYEVFNIPNHWRPGFAPAGVSTTTLQTAKNAGNFGQMQVFGDPRIMQFALKYIF